MIHISTYTDFIEVSDQKGVTDLAKDPTDLETYCRIGEDIIIQQKVCNIHAQET